MRLLHSRCLAFVTTMISITANDRIKCSDRQWLRVHLALTSPLLVDGVFVGRHFLNSAMCIESAW